MLNKSYVLYGIMLNVENDISNWLNNELDKKKWTQADLARASGLSRAYISLLISGKTSLGVESIKGIAKALRLPVAEVMQKAGMLPKNTTSSEKIEKLLFYFNQMDDDQQQDVLDYSDFILSK